MAEVNIKVVVAGEEFDIVCEAEGLTPAKVVHSTNFQRGTWKLIVRHFQRVFPKEGQNVNT